MSDSISHEVALESLELMCGACAIGNAFDVIRNQPSVQPDRSLLFRIGEICVDEYKWEITAEVVVEKIRVLFRVGRRENE